MLMYFVIKKTDGGGWTVIQYRYDFAKRENFYRRWTEYKLGFGNLESEFWLGLDNIHALVSDSLMELRIDLEDYEGNIIRWANYSYFQIFWTKVINIKSTWEIILEMLEMD
ncbi:Ficolin-2 [Armadillidium vulgare]|nr:Ficolin-2 [Armadillidium vulgare]